MEALPQSYRHEYSFSLIIRWCQNVYLKHHNCTLYFHVQFHCLKCDDWFDFKRTIPKKYFQLHELTEINSSKRKLIEFEICVLFHVFFFFKSFTETSLLEKTQRFHGFVSKKMAKNGVSRLSKKKEFNQKYLNHYLYVCFI